MTNNEFNPELLSKLHQRKRQRQIEQNAESRREKERRDFKKFTRQHGSQVRLVKIHTKKPLSTRAKLDKR